MPTPPAVRSAATAAVLLLAVTGCSLFERDSGSDEDRSAPGTSVTPAPATTTASPTRTPSVSTVRETCDRAGEAAHEARDTLREHPEELLAEIDELAETAPPELSDEIAAVRDAVDDYRKGDRSYLGVLREAKNLQERCTA
ncbi:hypothetical protein ACH9EU_16310 [Kocuria sp. M1R5S2]|uniref:hypothetical protein n=1 Tax=Kocuria rhizosphaerae TaxID=3376285 RepID=UPI0037BE11C7